MYDDMTNDDRYEKKKPVRGRRMGGWNRLQKELSIEHLLCN